MSITRDIFYALGLTVTAPIWGLRMLQTGKWRTDWAGRFGHVPAGAANADKQSKTVLVHAVSVGEVTAAAPLVGALLARGLRVVVSVTTDTGTARARAIFQDAVPIVRYPLDLSRCVNRFLDSIQPDAVALVELELWPNFMDACTRRGIPVAVVNGRLSERSFARYQKLGRLVGSSFRKLSIAAVQTPDYARRFEAMGVPGDRVVVVDSMKWDAAAVQPPEQVEGAAELARAMGIDRGRPVVVAGSTGPGEEKLLIDSLDALGQGAQLVLVPRKPERFDEVARLAPNIVRRSDRPDGSEQPMPEGAQLFLVDTMGELLKAYALADVALVGRSFLGMHGSNPLEPASLGCATVIGPHHSDFSDMVGALRDAGAIEVSADPTATAARLLNDKEVSRTLGENAKQVILSRQGATQRQAALVEKLIKKG